MNFMNWFQRRKHQVKPSSSLSTPPYENTEYNFESVRITSVADYLKLIGMTVEVSTRKSGTNDKGKCFSGRIKDLSDSGDHLVLEDIHQKTSDGSNISHRLLKVPLTDIDIIVVTDRNLKCLP